MQAKCATRTREGRKKAPPPSPSLLIFSKKNVLLPGLVTSFSPLSSGTRHCSSSAGHHRRGGLARGQGNKMKIKEGRGGTRSMACCNSQAAQQGSRSKPPVASAMAAASSLLRGCGPLRLLRLSDRQFPRAKNFAVFRCCSCPPARVLHKRFALPPVPQTSGCKRETSRLKCLAAGITCFSVLKVFSSLPPRPPLLGCMQMDDAPFDQLDAAERGLLDVTGLSPLLLS